MYISLREHCIAVTQPKVKVCHMFISSLTIYKEKESLNKYFHQKPPGVSLCLSIQRCQGNLSLEGLPFPQAEIWLQFNDDWVCQPDDNSKTKKKLRG